ncbi:glycosyltransferase [Candidatus Parcubacteria bacterium]|nr:MAG: glycosyltransferase [Candidatus Parcubacteria bacterium]
MKTIFTFHGLSLLDPGHQTSFWLKRFYFVLYKQLSQFVDTSVFVCQTNLQLAKKLGLINDGIVIYNGQDPSPLNFYSRPQARQKLSFLFEQSPPQAFWLVSIGRLAYPKNFEFIINQFPFLLQKNPFLRWVIIGEGPERKKYQRLINQLRLNNKIFLLGARPDAHRLLKAFDLFVLPSHYEGLSITLLEALFADLPILASRVGGNAEVVGGEEAELYAPNSSQDFQSKLLALIQSLKLRQQIIAKHQHLKPRFLFQNTFSKYLSIYLA